VHAFTPRRLGPCAAVAAILVLAGCSHTGNAAAVAAPLHQGYQAQGYKALPAGVVNATKVPLNVPNSITMRKKVEITSCGKADGGWQASGLAANASAGPADYTITVFFTTPGDTVIGTGVTRVHVAAKAKATWQVISTFHPAPTTNCILRGVNLVVERRLATGHLARG
jgi:hypothetical protein